MANLGTDWTKVTSIESISVPFGPSLSANPITSMEDATSWSKELSSAISTTWSRVLVFFSLWQNADEEWENVTSMYEEM